MGQALGTEKGSLEPASPEAYPRSTQGKATPTTGRKGKTGAEKCGWQETARDQAAQKENRGQSLDLTRKELGAIEGFEQRGDRINMRLYGEALHPDTNAP